MARALPPLLVTLLITSNALAMGPQQRIIIEQIIGTAPTKPSLPAGESYLPHKGQSRAFMRKLPLTRPRAKWRAPKYKKAYKAFGSKDQCGTVHRRRKGG